MSSYLNFYLTPKKRKDTEKTPEPLCFNSYSRSFNIYRYFYEELNPAFIGNGEKANYTEISVKDVEGVIHSVRSDLAHTEEKLQFTTEAYKQLSDKPIDEAVENYVSTQEYIKELKEDIAELEGIKSWMEGLEYSDFEEKVLINID